ncbi:hypothetical protein L6R52_11950 [Myxococcota bacterium]|nr:hypothetical protein [Myxococcota bacterium]
MSGIKGVGGNRGWVGRLSAERTVAEKTSKPELGGGAVKAGAPIKAPDAKLGASPLAGLGVPEKVLKDHAAPLGAAIADVTGIADFGGKLEPWRQRGIERIVEQLYKNLGLALSQVPAESRPALAKESLGAMRALMERTGGGDQLASTISAALGLFESGLRLTTQKRLVSTPAEQLGAMKVAVDAVSTLSDALATRAGTSTALNVFPVLVEQLERSRGALTPKARQEIWSAVSKLLVEDGPKTGTTQDLVAELAKALGAALEAKPASVEAALTDTRARFFEAFAQPRRDMENGLALVPQLAEGTPSRAYADALNDALKKTLAAHPVTTAPLYPAMFDLRARADELLRAFPAEGLTFIPSIAAIVAKLGPTEVAEPALATLGAWITQLANAPLASAGLEKAAAARDLGATARGLVEAALGMGRVAPADVPGLDVELAKLEKLAPTKALQVAVALAPVLADGQGNTASVVRHVIEAAERGGKNDLVGFLRDFALRDRHLTSAFALYGISGNDATKQQALAAAVASISTGHELGAAANVVASLVRTVEASLPGARVREMIAPDAQDRPGLWKLADPGVRYRNGVEPFFDQLVAAAARGGASRGDATVQTTAVRAALAIAAAVGNLDGNADLPFRRIAADLEAAFADAKELTWAKPEKNAVGLRAQNQHSVAAFLDAHTALPMELALTAGVHLDQPSMAWLTDRMERSAGRDTRRALRDFIFGCVDAGRLDLVEALRTTQAPPKAVSRAIAFVGAQFRLGQLGQVPFDRLVEGFKANVDAIAQVEQEKMKATLDGIGLGALIEGGKATEVGLAELAKCKEPIKYVLEHLVDGYVAANDGDHLQCGPVRAPFSKALQSIAEGTWPAPKYENEGGKRQLATLSGPQQALWRQESVTALNAPVNPEEQARLAETMTLLKGVAKALERSAPVVAGIPNLDWSPASLGTLERVYAEKVAALRNVEKGSADHRKLSSEIGPTREALALVRFAVGVRGANGDPKTALLNLKETLADAVSALKAAKMGAAVEVVRDAMYEAQAIKTSPKQGTYAVDTDNPEALLASSRGGCCDYTSYRRWVPAMMLLEANQKVIRVYEGERWSQRALFHFHEAKIPGDPPYEGPVLFLNYAYGPNGGQQANASQALLYKHALEKAFAMGVPLITPADVSAAARELGAQQQNVRIEVQMTPGTTGFNFSDYYFTHTEGHYDYVYDVHKLAAGKPKGTVAKAINVVMPPKA